MSEVLERAAVDAPPERVRDARDVCDALLVVRHEQAAAAARELALVADLIDLYSTVDDSLVQGAERLVPAGADGTPGVAEFLPLELGPLLGMSEGSASNLVADVANLRHRHPRLWRAVHSLAVPVWQARTIAQQVAASGLDAEAARWLDERLAPGLGRLPWGRLRRKLAGLIVRADTALAAERAKLDAANRFVHVRHNGRGMAMLYARLTTPEAVTLQNAIDAIVHNSVTDGATGTPDQLAADALVTLATPTKSAGGRLPRPAATLVVHVARETLASGEGVARPDDPELGPLLLEQVAQLLGHARVRVLPVLDLAGDPQVDSYEIPDRIREQVRIVEPYSIFPYSTARSGRADLDHLYPYDPQGPPGQTRPSNLAPESRVEHRAKTHCGWLVDPLEPGVQLWTSPLGYTYVADRYGYRRVHNLNDYQQLCDLLDQYPVKGHRDLSQPIPDWVDLY